MQKGTTQSHLRPFNTECKLEENQTTINILDVLVVNKFAQSKAEAKRLVEQRLIWIDNFTTDLEVSTVWDRLVKIDPDNGKFINVRKGDLICVGKRLDDAVCHRINLT